MIRFEMLKVYILLQVAIIACYAELMLIDPRISGGLQAEIEDVPYVATVQVPMARGPTHFSTGTILNQRWILTTASRIKYFSSPYTNIKVRTGSTHSDKFGTVYGVEEKIQHPSYDPYKYDFDLALLKVDRNIELSENTKSIELYLSEDTVDANLTGSLAGWGNTNINSTKVSRLYTVELKTVGTVDGLNLYVNPISNDVCFSDVGGPFVVDGKVLGISTVNRLGCGSTNQYITRFDASTLEWINGVIV